MLDQTRRALRGESVVGDVERAGRIIERRIAPFLDVEGRLEGAIAVGIDVTEQRLAERELLATTEKPDLLLDLKLPLIDGHTVLRQLRCDPRTRQLPVVILTTSAEERDLTEAYRNGANSYVRKPVDFLEFIDATKVLGLYWAVLNRQPNP